MGSEEPVTQELPYAVGSHFPYLQVLICIAPAHSCSRPTLEAFRDNLFRRVEAPQTSTLVMKTQGKD